MDFILHATICKHIHMVCIKLKQIEGSDSTTEMVLQSSVEPVDMVEEEPEQVSTSESIDNLENTFKQLLLMRLALL